MKTQKKRTYVKRLTALAVCLGWIGQTGAAPLINFQFNEGSGNTTRDSVSGLIGLFGTQQDPATDTVRLIDESPSGQAGDRAIETAGVGFLLATDTNQVLNITNGPITLESWVYIDPNTPAKAAEGTIAYGNSYKMGLRSGLQVFTLYGIVDIVNNTAGPVPAGQWVHMAAAWEPGVGVRFFVNGAESFEANTTPAARPTLHNYLSLASEGLGNNMVARLDRMRIHRALLTAEQIDSVAASPKAPLANTLVSYDFNQTAFPATNSAAAQLPTLQSSEVLASLTGPAWTNDTPSGATNDYALAFLSANPPVKEFVTVNFGDTPIDLAANGTNYTLQAWVKLPTGPLEERRVILRTDGPAPRVALSINANRTLHTTVIGTADFTTSVAVPNDNRWHHIAVVMEDFARLRFYLDGYLRQTVNRTQTGVPSSGGDPRMLIGKESEARYFRGVLDRVIVDNSAVPQQQLDFRAAPGLPVFATFNSHPVSVIAPAGTNVTFNAPTLGATGHQWYYRTNLADLVGVPLAGETRTNLTLTNVTAANEGYYYLVATNASGRAESYAARLALRSNFALPATGFEAPEYRAGNLEEQREWTNDQNGSIVRVATAAQIAQALQAAGLTPGQTVHSGDQALLIGGAGLATTTIRQVIGLENETNVNSETWIRPLGAGTSGAAVGNFFLALENSAGTRAAAFRLGPANSLDYGTAITGVWQPSGVTLDENQWYRIRMAVNYQARTYDFYVNDEKVNAEPIPFYTATADRFNQIRIFRGANQAGAILDDLSVTSPNSVPEASLSISRQGNQIVISWPASATGYVLQATDRLVPANWSPVQHTTQGANNQAVVEPTGQSRFFRLVRNQ